MNMEIVFFVLFVCLVLGSLGAYGYRSSLAKRQEALKLLLGLCYVSNLRKGEDGNLEVALKTNQGKFWYAVPAGHPSLLDLQSSLSRFVYVSLNDQLPGGLQLVFVGEFYDSLQARLSSIELALTEVANTWPLWTGGLEQLLASLSGEYTPLEQERVLASLVSWQQQYWDYPELSLLLREAEVGMRREKLFARM